MRFAEVFLRLGAALVAWMLIFTHVLWLAALPRLECGVDGAEMHALLLGLSPMTLVAAGLIHVTRPFADVHCMLRWLGVPILLLVPLCLLVAWNVLGDVNLDGLPVCAGIEPATWHAFWAPAQFIVAIALVIVVTRNFRTCNPKATA